MRRRFKLKINGESPRSLFLAFVLSKLNCDVYVYNFQKSTNSKKDYQIFLISNFTKNLFSKFDIWKEIEDISYEVTSLSIKDNLVSEELLLHTENIQEKHFKTIGWIAQYSDLKSLLINKLINSDNFHFILKNQLIDKSLNFDYEFNFENNDKFLNLLKFPLSTFKRLDEQILVFNVYLRGNIKKRFYEINTTNGLIVLTPLEKNLYQIIWNITSSRIKDTSISSKSFFLDNLTTLLPNELKVDQIIGDINLLNVNNICPFYLIKNKSIYFNENKFKSNSTYDFNFDIFINNVLKIFNLLESNETFKLRILNKLGFNLLIRKYIQTILNFSFFNTLFNLFIVNNIFLLLIRKILFIILKKINFLKFLIIKNINNRSINNLIK